VVYTAPWYGSGGGRREPSRRCGNPGFDSSALPLSCMGRNFCGPSARGRTTKEWKPYYYVQQTKFVILHKKIAVGEKNTTVSSEHSLCSFGCNVLVSCPLVYFSNILPIY
jgi:hypothetical protein